MSEYVKGNEWQGAGAQQMSIDSPDKVCAVIKTSGSV